ncbi:MAG TPA: hypothetical protein VF600_08620 [Abditibacteriaceae bacterium]
MSTIGSDAQETWTLAHQPDAERHLNPEINFNFILEPRGEFMESRL